MPSGSRPLATATAGGERRNDAFSCPCGMPRAVGKQPLPQLIIGSSLESNRPDPAGSPVVLERATRRPQACSHSPGRSRRQWRGRGARRIALSSSPSWRWRPPHRPMDMPDAAVANRRGTLKMLSRRVDWNRNGNGGRCHYEATGFASACAGRIHGICTLGAPRVTTSTPGEANE
jgi:hypothetical protein